MLFQLNINNMALIRTLNIEFEEGLNVLTGETGAGKSIIIQAINIILGNHASSDLIREGENNLLVEGLFIISKPEKEWLNNIYPNMKIIDDALIIKREINKKGRSKCYINDRLLNLTALQKIGRFLVDLHGQHSHQSLLDSSSHIDLLDRFGGESILNYRNELSLSYRLWRSKMKILLEINFKKDENLKKIDYLKFQSKEIEEAFLSIDEDRVLEEEEVLIKNSKRVLDVMEKAVEVLHEGGFEQISVRDIVSEISSNMSGIVSLDKRIEPIQKNLQEIGYLLEDTVDNIINYKDKINLNQQRLKEIEERLNIINHLKNKYGNTIEKILNYHDSIQNELDKIDYNDEKIGKLQEDIEDLEENISLISKKLSNERIKIALKIEKEVMSELNELKMKNCHFAVIIAQSEVENGIDIGGKKYKMTEKGIDNIEFLISPNPGESLRPLAQIVSGGEVSRIMLALKSILSEVDQIPTLIFDEVDSGVGARLGEVIADKLKNIAKKRQVICVTHLPQIACKSQKHFYIEKKVIENSTWIGIGEIESEDQVMEIARMIDGNRISDITIMHARKMLSR